MTGRGTRAFRAAACAALVVAGCGGSGEGGDGQASGADGVGAADAAEQADAADTAAAPAIVGTWARSTAQYDEELTFDAAGGYVRSSASKLTADPAITTTEGTFALEGGRLTLATAGASTQAPYWAGGDTLQIQAVYQRTSAAAASADLPDAIVGTWSLALEDLRANGKASSTVEAWVFAPNGTYTWSREDRSPGFEPFTVGSGSGTWVVDGDAVQTQGDDAIQRWALAEGDAGPVLREIEAGREWSRTAP